MKVGKYKKILFSNEEKNKIINDYANNNKSTFKIASEFGIGWSVVYKLLLENNVEILGSRRLKYTVNHNYFEKIDTELKAYTLGLLYADGGNLKNKAIYLQLNCPDDHVLETIGSSFQDRPLYSYKTQLGNGYKRLVISGSNVGHLIKHGVVERKTLKISGPHLDHQSLFRHFIRGYFDGDGSISINDRTSRVLVSFVGNPQFLKWLKLYISENADINSSLLEIKNSSKVLRLCISGNAQIERFLDWMYKDSSIHLYRKFSKYESLKDIRKNTNMRYSNPRVKYST